MALTFALPAFVFYLSPNLLKVTRISYFIGFLFCFLTIGLTDLFTYCILLPPFFIIGIALTKAKYKTKTC
jgi:uncharacterized membrane protein